MAAKPQVALYLARHGTTQLNEQDRFRGPLNVPLDAQGVKDAEGLGDYFRNVPLGAIVHTGKVRTELTARIVLGHHSEDIPLGSNTDLQAWNLGEFAGKEKNAATLKRLQVYVDDPAKVVPGGESLDTFRSRVRPAIAEALRARAITGRPTLLVVHSSIVHELGNMVNGDTKAALVKPGGIAAVVNDGGKLVAKALTRPDPRSGGVVS
jgi:broad specificity phosphatase PhoE